MRQRNYIDQDDWCASPIGPDVSYVHRQRVHRFSVDAYKTLLITSYSEVLYALFDTFHFTSIISIYFDADLPRVFAGVYV